MMDSYNVDEPNKDDNSHSPGVCFHIFVRPCDINFNEIIIITVCIRIFSVNTVLHFRL